METKPPTVVIDFKKNRIVITRRTLHILGDPKFILLSVNPDERTLFVSQGGSADKLAHKIPPLKTERQREVALHSKALLESLQGINADLKSDCVYRIKGDFIQSENILRYRVADAVLTCGME
jgi:hypothetical protein